MRQKTGIKKGDVFVIAILSLACVFLFAFPLFSRSENTVASVWYGGKKVKEIKLSDVSEGCEFSVGGCVFSVEKGKICFASSSCPDKLCVKSGYLSKNGDTAACLPNKVVVKIENNKEKLDAVAY